jgi:hypothetical protein
MIHTMKLPKRGRARIPVYLEILVDIDYRVRLAAAGAGLSLSEFYQRGAELMLADLDRKRGHPQAEGGGEDTT